MSVKVIDNHPMISSRTQAKIPVFIRSFAEAVLVSSRPRTPYKEGNLRRQTRIEVLGNKGRLKWLVDYASFQERGYTSGPVRRYTTAGTGKNFAIDAVKKEANRVTTHAKKAGLA